MSSKSRKIRPEGWRFSERKAKPILYIPESERDNLCAKKHCMFNDFVSEREKNG